MAPNLKAIKAIAYDYRSDVSKPTGSIFTRNGAGTYIAPEAYELFVKEMVLQIPLCRGRVRTKDVDFAPVDKMGGGHIQFHHAAQESHHGLFALIGHRAIAVGGNHVVGETLGQTVKVTGVETSLIFGL